MKFYIANVRGGSFQDKDDNRTIEYGSVTVLDEEVTKKDGFAGQDVRQMKASPDLIHKIKDFVPAMFECDIEIVGKDSKVKIVSAKLIDTKLKAS